MQREAGKYLFDIRESIVSIEQYLGKERDFDDVIIWGIITKDIPILKAEINEIIGDISE